tara:strand:+ start:5448 stop:5999 length:552 start_codon:yes stop_codon:yes gene_type:complete
MPWRNGRYVPKESTVPLRPDIDRNTVSNIVRNKVSSFSLESRNFDDNLFDSTLINRLFVAGSFTASFLSRVIGASTFSAKSGLRKLFESGFVNSSMIEDGSITGAKITNPIKIALIDGGSAGAHTVSGITTRDELIAVFEQNGTSGILTNLSTEFSIKKADTIDNTGGTATSSDKLLVFYLSK